MRQPPPVAHILEVPIRPTAIPERFEAWIGHHKVTGTFRGVEREIHEADLPRWKIAIHWRDAKAQSYWTRITSIASDPYLAVARWLRRQRTIQPLRPCIVSRDFPNLTGRILRHPDYAVGNIYVGSFTIERIRARSQGELQRVISDPD